MAVVETSMHFLARDKLYEHEKPYQLKYEAENGIPRSNLRLEKHEPIKISSIRGRERQFSMEDNGFAVLKLDREIPYNDFSDPGGIRKYLDVVSESLRKFLGADRVQVFQHLVSQALRALIVKKDFTEGGKDSKTQSGFPHHERGEQIRLQPAVDSRSYRYVPHL